MVSNPTYTADGACHAGSATDVGVLNSYLIVYSSAASVTVSSLVLAVLALFVVRASQL